MGDQSCEARPGETMLWCPCGHFHVHLAPPPYMTKEAFMEEMERRGIVLLPCERCGEPPALVPPSGERVS